MSQTQPLLVHGLQLPPQVQAAIADGAWVLPPDPGLLEGVFTEAPSPGAELYSLDLMVRENDAWVDASPEELEQYGGPGSNAADHLTVEPRTSVLIGDLGHDMPIALDYSVSPDQPRVVYLPSHAPGWIEVAADITSFMAALGIGSPG
jgi:hypothetical protein